MPSPKRQRAPRHKGSKAAARRGRLGGGGGGTVSGGEARAPHPADAHAHGAPTAGAPVNVCQREALCSYADATLRRIVGGDKRRAMSQIEHAKLMLQRVHAACGEMERLERVPRGQGVASAAYAAKVNLLQTAAHAAHGMAAEPLPLPAIADEDCIARRTRSSGVRLDAPHIKQRDWALIGRRRLASDHADDQSDLWDGADGDDDEYGETTAQRSSRHGTAMPPARRVRWDSWEADASDAS